jgi:hypothetical protein
VRLTGQAQVLWRQLADEAGEELVVTAGAIDYGPARVQEKMHEILTGSGVPAELMTAGAAAGLGLDPAPVGGVTCLYTSTANEDFILDRYGPFVVCSPCSGHGAKFAPLVGEIAADLACGGASPEPRFTLAARFG